MSALSYDGALHAAADRHMSSGAGVTGNVTLEVVRGGECIDVDVLVEDGGVSYAMAVAATDQGGTTYRIDKPYDVELTAAEQSEAIERAAYDAHEAAEQRREDSYDRSAE